MKIGFKKIRAAMLAAVMTAVMFFIPAGAASIANTAVSRRSGEEFVILLGDGKEYDYKVRLTKGGDLKISLTSACEGTCFWVYDSKGNSVSCSIGESEAEIGSFDYSFFIDGDFCRWNDILEEFKGTVVFKDLEKGTYYIRVGKETHSFADYSDRGKATIQFTFPGEAVKEKPAPSLSITVKKGETLDLGTVSTEEPVTWSSSDKGIASVTKSGEVTAKKKGSAVIRAKAGKTTLSVTVIVE